MRSDALLDFINFIILRHSTNADRYCFIITVDSIFSCIEHWEQTLSQTMNITINQSCHMVGFVFGTRAYICMYALFLESMLMYSNFFPSLTFISSILIIYLQHFLHILDWSISILSATAAVAAAAVVFLSLVGKGFSEYFVVTHIFSVDLLNGIENGEQ